MKMSAVAWVWVDFDVPEEVEKRWAVMSGDAIRTGRPIEDYCSVDEDDDWLSVVIKLLAVMLRSKSQSMVLNPSVYPSLSALRATPFTCANAYMKRRFTLPNSRADFGKAIVETIRTHLPQWLNFAQSGGRVGRDERVRAWFVDALDRLLGEEFLTTGLAWNAFVHFKASHVVERHHMHRFRTMERGILKPFEEALLAQPILTIGSIQHAEYHEYSEAIKKARVHVDY